MSEAHDFRGRFFTVRAVSSVSAYGYSVSIETHTTETEMIIKGVTDTITTCDKCGKSNLKKTVELETESGEIVHFGSDCAAAALLGKKSRKGADAVARLAGAVSFVKRNMGTMKVGTMHDRLAACAWANVSAAKNGTILIWNDAGKVEVPA